jgi:hypothetical protein
LGEVGEPFQREPLRRARNVPARRRANQLRELGSPRGAETQRLQCVPHAAAERVEQLAPLAHLGRVLDDELEARDLRHGQLAQEDGDGARGAGELKLAQLAVRARPPGVQRRGHDAERRLAHVLEVDAAVVAAVGADRLGRRQARAELHRAHLGEELLDGAGGPAGEVELQAPEVRQGRDPLADGGAHRAGHGERQPLELGLRAHRVREAVRERRGAARRGEREFAEARALGHLREEVVELSDPEADVEVDGLDAGVDEEERAVQTGWGVDSPGEALQVRQDVLPRPGLLDHGEDGGRDVVEAAMRISPRASVERRPCYLST